MPNYEKADLFKRFLAILIDSMIAGILSFIPFFGIGWFLAGFYMIFRDGLSIDFMNNRSFGKRVLKLRIINLANPDKPAGFISSLARNWIFLIPIAFKLIPSLFFLPSAGQVFFMLINAAMPGALLVYLIEGIKVIDDSAGKRFGDDWAKTVVVEE